MWPAEISSHAFDRTKRTKADIRTVQIVELNLFRNMNMENALYFKK